MVTLNLTPEEVEYLRSLEQVAHWTEDPDAVWIEDVYVDPGLAGGGEAAAVWAPVLSRIMRKLKGAV